MKSLAMFFILMIFLSSHSVAKPSTVFESLKSIPKETREIHAFLSHIETGDMMLFKGYRYLPKETLFGLMLSTSAANQCLGCVCTAVRQLARMNVTQNKILALQSEDLPGLPDKEKALYKVAYELSLRPGTVAKFIEKAEKAGWTDSELTHAILTISQFNLKNRIRNGFQLGPDESHPYKSDQKLPMATCEAECATCGSEVAKGQRKPKTSLE